MVLPYSPLASEVLISLSSESSFSFSYDTEYLYNLSVCLEITFFMIYSSDPNLGGLIPVN